MKVIAWNNGDYNLTGAGYGLRLDPTGRDAVFDRSWSEVTADLPNGVSGLRAPLSPSFWRDCPELRGAEIGKWLIGSGYSRWPKGDPPAFTLTKLRGNHFKVS